MNSDSSETILKQCPLFKKKRFNKLEITSFSIHFHYLQLTNEKYMCKVCDFSYNYRYSFLCLKRVNASKTILILHTFTRQTNIKAVKVKSPERIQINSVFMPTALEISQTGTHRCPSDNFSFIVSVSMGFTSDYTSHFRQSRVTMTTVTIGFTSLFS